MGVIEGFACSPTEYCHSVVLLPIPEATSEILLVKINFKIPNTKKIKSALVLT